MGLLHEGLTYKLKGCFYYVHNSLGLGYDEESYHLALEEQLRKEGIRFESKVTKYLVHRNQKVHKFVADLIIEHKIVLELKAIQTEFHPTHYLQIFSYLKNWNLNLGLLVNFGLPSLESKRVIYSEKKPTILENYEEIIPYLSPTCKILLKRLRTAIFTVLNTHGLGYSDTIFLKLLQAELKYQQIPFKSKIFVPIQFERKVIRQFPLETPIIDNQILCKIIAQKEEEFPDISKIRTYLNDTGIPIGLLIHFGKKALKITAIQR